MYNVRYGKLCLRYHATTSVYTRNEMKNISSILILLILTVCITSASELLCQNGGTYVNVTSSCDCLAPYGGDDCSIAKQSRMGGFLLSFVFGPLGADRFWLGYTGIGIAKLLLNLFAPLPFCIFAWCMWNKIMRNSDKII